jgi:hypothetical protein
MVLPNANVSLEVSAFSISDLNYQWYKDGIAIEGATTPVYFIENAQGADSGSYTVTVNNEYANVINEATLDVITERTGDPDSDFRYSISGGVVSIKRYLGSKKEVVIPNMIEGCLVTEISSMAFLNCFDITNVIILIP